MKNKIAPISIAIAALLTIGGYTYNSNQPSEPQNTTEVSSSQQSNDLKYQLGKHYIKLPESFPEYEGKVVSFIWYGCHACATVKPYMESFNDGKDVVQNIHMSRGADDYQASIFFALEYLGHSNLHSELTKLGSKGELSSLDDYLAFLETKGIKSIDMKNAMALDSVIKAQEKSNSDFMKAGFTGTPSMIIDGKYTINMGEMKSWSDIIGVLEQVYQNEMIER